MDLFFFHLDSAKPKSCPKYLPKPGVLSSASEYLSFQSKKIEINLGDRRGLYLCLVCFLLCGVHVVAVKNVIGSKGQCGGMKSTS